MNAQTRPQTSNAPVTEYGVVTAADTVRIERLLPGPIERVWSYLTDSEKRGRWLSSGPMELRVGGRVEHFFRNSDLTKHEKPPAKYARFDKEIRMEGKVTACDPPRLLAYTWNESWGEESEVTFELSPQGDDVRLILTHRRLPNRTEMLAVAAGWHTHLGILADRLSARTPPGFWSTFERLEAEYDKLIP